jgi:hypothetical protein
VSWLLFACLLLLTPDNACAQQQDSAPDLMRRLQVPEKRLTESEDLLKARNAELADAIARIRALESRAGEETASEKSDRSPQANAVVPAQDSKPAISAMAGMPDHDAAVLFTPKMNIRGFGDVRFGEEAYEASPASFAFGQLDLYITSRLSDRTSVLMETVFESEKNNALGVDIERILVQQRINRYLKIEGGRNHTAIGYYNTAYHHGTWFQTAIARPFFFAVEDEGGLLRKQRKR